MVPELLLTIDGAARDLTIDKAGNVYVFDYDQYVIRKFDPHGASVVAFGSTGQEPGRFSHLMAIQVHGDSLLALDAGSISVFELSGQFRARRMFSDTIYCDFPRMSPDGRWLGGWLEPETAEHVLTYRAADGTEIARLASYPLADVFPEIEAGERFFVNPVQAPSYLYDFRPDGRVLWMASDQLRIFEHHESQTVVLSELEATPVPYPADEITLLQQRQARLQPPFHLNVPEHYQLAHHLLVAESGDVWLYVLSQERTGLLRLSPTGREKGFYQVAGDIDMLAARLTLANQRMYALVSGREQTSIYSLRLP